MKTTRTTAERMRPILQAMERSIDAARRQRLHDTDGPARQGPIAAEQHADGEIPRRKARPKRATPMLHHGGSEYRAEAV